MFHDGAGTQLGISFNVAHGNATDAMTLPLANETLTNVTSDWSASWCYKFRVARVDSEDRTSSDPFDGFFSEDCRTVTFDGCDVTSVWTLF